MTPNSTSLRSCPTCSACPTCATPRYRRSLIIRRPQPQTLTTSGSSSNLVRDHRGVDRRMPGTPRTMTATLPPACIRDIRPTMVSTGHFYEFQNSTPIIRRSRWQCGCPDDLHNPHDLSPPRPSRRFTGKTSCALVLQKTCISNKQFSTMAVRPLHVIPTWSTRETNTSPRGLGRTILESRNSHRDVFR